MSNPTSTNVLQSPARNAAAGSDSHLNRDPGAHNSEVSGSQHLRQVLVSAVLPDRAPDRTDEFLARLAKLGDMSEILGSIAKTLSEVEGKYQ